jgi:hypothetical protein
MNPRYPLKFLSVIVLVVSLIAAAIFALFIYSFFEGELRWFLLYYFTPIGIPFVAFLLDRAEGYALASKTSRAIDLVVLIPALTRAFIPLPLVSGHALFLTYCLLTTRSSVARITAVIVLLQVAYLKLFVTHDTALFGGLVVGCLAALLYRRLHSVERQIQLDQGL